MHLSQVCVVICVISIVAVSAFPSPYDRLVPLYNAAESGLMIPHTGLGTGGYTASKDHVESVKNWLQKGGRRLDCSLTYGDQDQVAQGMHLSGVPRKDVFITSKVGPTDPMGYDDILSQFDLVLSTLNTTYVDLLLIHWPGSRPTAPSKKNSTDPACVLGPTNEPVICRQHSWKALEAIFASGRARSIGVSNFEKHHIEDILAMNSSVPSVNQIEFHPYWHEDGLVEFCQAHKILVNAYSPLGAPDMSRQKGWHLTTERLLLDIGKHHNKTAAQVILQWEWQQGLIVNPRTNNTEHMTENLQFAGQASAPFHLGHVDMELIRGLHHTNGKICPDPHDIP